MLPSIIIYIHSHIIVLYILHISYALHSQSPSYNIHYVNYQMQPKINRRTALRKNTLVTSQLLNITARNLTNEILHENKTRES